MLQKGWLLSEVARYELWDAHDAKSHASATQFPSVKVKVHNPLRSSAKVVPDKTPSPYVDIKKDEDNAVVVDRMFAVKDGDADASGVTNVVTTVGNLSEQVASLERLNCLDSDQASAVLRKIAAIKEEILVAATENGLSAGVSAQGETKAKETPTAA